MNRELGSGIYRLRCLKQNRGSALVLVLVIIVVLTVLCGAFLSGILLHRKFILREVNRIQTRYLAESAVEKCLWALEGHDGRDIMWRPAGEFIPLMDGHEAAVRIESWGGFLRITATAFCREESVMLEVLAGEKLNRENRDAITMTTKVSENLVVTGSNRIIGDVTVGNRGVSTSMIRGRPFSGKKPVEGEIHRDASPDMPFFDGRFYRSLIDACTQALSGGGMSLSGNPMDSIRQFDGDMVFGTGSDSLFELPGTFVARGNLLLDGSVRVTSPCRFISAGTITVQGNASLNHCILYADSGITVQDDAHMTAQLVSPSLIVIKDRARLDYPSAAYCPCLSETGRILGRIEIQDRAVFRGTLILDAPSGPESAADRTAVFTSVSPNAGVVGKIYTRGRTVFEGHIVGTVVTEGFSFYDWPTTYLNWLKDAVFDRPGLPESFCTPLLFSREPDLEIMEWITDDAGRSPLVMASANTSEGPDAHE